MRTSASFTHVHISERNSRAGAALDVDGDDHNCMGNAGPIHAVSLLAQNNTGAIFVSTKDGQECFPERDLLAIFACLLNRSPVYGDDTFNPTQFWIFRLTLCS